ncbi:MAG: leucyl aminopeptidase family protein [Alphaproteobacteria bacterium]|nr:leucyl aminopeptidase family protein [Alphaproteobacteria bacterium]
MSLPQIDVLIADDGRPAVALHAVAAADWEAFAAGQGPRLAAWAKAQDFSGQPGKVLLLPDEAGGLGLAVLGLGKGDDKLIFGAAATALPAGTYRIAGEDAVGAHFAALGFALGAYAYNAFKPSKAKTGRARLLVAPAALPAAARQAAAIWFARDLVNAPSNAMGPAELETAARAVAAPHDASIRLVEGDDLVARNYPMIHAVGRASVRAPRLIDLTWGDAHAPKVTLVGKGVCFDSGGLDIKSAAGMALMKKDMGGAAAMLGLAHMVMDAGLKVRLRVLIPAVENAISGDAYRPGDVLASRKGLTVEIGNTDAEGRLVLADALADADDEGPDLLICMATLTGAARVATGFELPPLFTHDEALAADLAAAALAEQDPMWRLPLWKNYDGWIEGKVADLTNAADSAYAGSITAALFLNRFVTRTKSFVHFDVAAWTDKPRPGHPVGAEAQCIRALFAVLRNRFGSKTA